MPFFCGIPANMPVNPDGVSAPVVGSGPYFIKEWTKNRRIVLARNRFYKGPAPHNVNGFTIDIGLPLETIKLNIDRGATDTGDIPPAAHADLGRRYGVKKASPGRYFANPVADDPVPGDEPRAAALRGPERRSDSTLPATFG